MFIFLLNIVHEFNDLCDSDFPSAITEHKAPTLHKCRRSRECEGVPDMYSANVDPLLLMHGRGEETCTKNEQLTDTSNFMEWTLEIHSYSYTLSPYMIPY